VHVLIQSKADANSQAVMDGVLLNNKCEAVRNNLLLHYYLVSFLVPFIATFIFLSF
jgi:hypothetical protein